MGAGHSHPLGTSMVLSAGSLSLRDGDVSPIPHPVQPAILRSLKTLAMRVFSFEGGVEDLHWLKLESNWQVALAVVLGMLGASLCSAGDVGGGGLFIPLFNILIGFDAKSAAALSNFMILGGALADVGWNIQQEHPFLSGQPLIDFDVALLLQPNMMLGISIGVICNVVFPSWFIVLEFIITLGYIIRRSFRSGLLRWRSETRLLQEEKEKTESSIEAQEQGQLLVKEKSSKFNVLTAYWLLTISQLPLAFFLTGWSAWHLHHAPAKNSSPELQLTAATTAFMVFFSSLSNVQFWLLGRLPLHFALLFAGVCLVSSLIGLRVVHQAITEFGRPSMIVFSDSIVLGVSAILTTIFGGLDVWKQYAAGEYMGFHNPC